MRLLRSALYIAVVIILSIFAKDNLVAEIKHLLSSDASSSATSVSSSGTIEVAFSPNGGATATIRKALAEAQKTILVAAYSFTSKPLAEALLEAKKRHVEVKIMLDKSQISERYSASTFFANQGFTLKIDTKHAIHHNKVMIIDDKTVITGSFNFTKGAESRNAENVVIIRNNPALARRYTENWQLHWHHSISRQESLRKNLAQKKP